MNRSNTPAQGDNSSPRIIQKYFKVIAPNSWGRQTYEGGFHDQKREIRIDVNRRNPMIGWIQEYTAKRLARLKFKLEGTGWQRANSTLTYK